MSNFISLSEETANRLIHMITIEKKFSPGERLPNEQILADMLKVSRTSLREAVKILIANGTLEIRRGVGTFVTEIPAMDSGSLIELCSEESKFRALEALNIRLILEPMMVKTAILNGTEEEKQLIYKYEENCREQIDAGKDYTYEDHLFHKSIAAASHNASYEQLLPILHSSIAIILKSPSFKKTALQSAENAKIYHRNMAESIQNDDLKGAELASRTHIYNSIKYLKSYF